MIIPPGPARRSLDRKTRIPRLSPRTRASRAAPLRAGATDPARRVGRAPASGDGDAGRCRVAAHEQGRGAEGERNGEPKRRVWRGKVRRASRDSSPDAGDGAASAPFRPDGALLARAARASVTSLSGSEPGSPDPGSESRRRASSPLFPYPEARCVVESQSTPTRIERIVVTTLYASDANLPLPSISPIHLWMPRLSYAAASIPPGDGCCLRGEVPAWESGYSPHVARVLPATSPLVEVGAASTTSGYRRVVPATLVHAPVCIPLPST
ncbi:hypothetical protein JHW43_005729 [Diplocarpon mali]|nr:hypothetical protein JHW43_005729 [Diplocarpon mali]